MGLNDDAWEELFEKHDILTKIQSNHFFEITANDIKKVREPRLMTKFDHKANLPKLFLDNNLAILPVTRGSYIISKYDAYHEFEPVNDDIETVNFPDDIESIDYENITSEATAINCAYVSGIIKDFIEEGNIYPTVSGRMSSNAFSFDIWNNGLKAKCTVNVKNSQIEIDGGYEGLESLSIIEAKNFISDDFLVRQLYYPFRTWKNKINKAIKPVFMNYSNGIYSLYGYEFADPNYYNSIVLVKQKNYSLEKVAICLDDLVETLKKVQIIKEPEVSFPQADSFKRVINLVELLWENEMTSNEITYNYAFTSRQTNYYTDAGRYLGLIGKRYENGDVIYFLTEEGRKTLKLKYRSRQLKFAELILRHKPFNEVLKRYLQIGEIPSRNEIVDIMKKSDLFKVASENTFRRRASTIASWVTWLVNLPR